MNTQIMWYYMIEFKHIMIYHLDNLLNNQNCCDAHYIALKLILKKPAKWELSLDILT